jgi:hypothetical protein
MRCANKSCRKQFTPTYSGQSVCSVNCKIEAQRAKRARIKANSIVNPPKKRRGRGMIPMMSKARKDMLAIYFQLRKPWLALPENQACACREELGCCKPGTKLEVHHMAGRNNKLLIDTRWWLPVCRTAHRKITDDSAWAIEQGYSVKRNV